jgi:hypothetical protein
MELQKGTCAICRKPEVVMDKKVGRLRNLAVDHCHGKGHVRGLLCQGCNQGLGNFKDSPEILLAAIKYLEDNRESTT